MRLFVYSMRTFDELPFFEKFCAKYNVEYDYTTETPCLENLDTVSYTHLVLIGTGGITATAAVIHHLWSRGMQANIQATEEQQKNLTDQGMVTQFDQAYTSANSDLTGMEVTLSLIHICKHL